MKFVFVLTFLVSSVVRAEPCDQLFPKYIEKRQELKRSLVAFTVKTEIIATRLDRGSSQTYTGGFTGLRKYSHRYGAHYENPKYSGDSAFEDGPLWAPGPLKIFVKQDEEANGPFVASDPEQLSRINNKTYKLMSCALANDDFGRVVYRFVIEPRAETEGSWYGFIDADPKTLLTLAEVSNRTILSGRARSKFGGRMKEFNFVRLFQIVDDRVSIPQIFRTRAKSQWGQYSDVKIEARFELVEYKIGDR